MNQDERLRYLVERFAEDSEAYRDIDIPKDRSERRRILRSLMNIRMPAPIDADVLQVQDDYLRARAEEKGVVTLSAIPTVLEALSGGSPHADQLRIWQGDITRLACDAIVNAANSQMLGCFVPMHTCIDNCIHTYAGVQLREECERQMRSLRIQYGKGYEQPTAVPMLTDAWNLPAKKVIHVVGPIVPDGVPTPEHERLLAECYRASLELAEKNALTSIAFCCISTGVFHFPNQRAAEIAVETVQNWLDETGSSMNVIFNVYQDRDLQIYRELLSI